MKVNKLLLVLPLVVAGLWGCREMSEPGKDYESVAGEYFDGEAVAPNSEEGGEQSQEFAGRVTAGEWSDLDHWLFWSELMTNKQYGQEGTDYTTYSDYWGLYSNNRVAVHVTDKAGKPLSDAAVTLSRAGGSVLWTARTDNEGDAELWIAFTQKTEEPDEATLFLAVNGEKQTVSVSVTHWGEEVKLNNIQLADASATPVMCLDVAFIVDATGSMSDEIDFLKADLENIINEVAAYETSVKIRTSALFYRDEGDEYVTRVSDFSNTLSTTTKFIGKQKADGGGDYPEAVHTALEKGLQELSWNEDKSMRIAFMLLDAPPHKQDDVILSLQKSIPLYAAKGVRVIPIAASGVDKPTEFFLRNLAIATDGTYVFLTNDSGVGGDHIEATVGEYKVELLRDIMVRLIKKYM